VVNWSQTHARVAEEEEEEQEEEEQEEEGYSKLTQ
jgi:hypothetical protein